MKEKLKEIAERYGYDYGLFCKYRQMEMNLMQAAYRAGWNAREEKEDAVLGEAEEWRQRIMRLIEWRRDPRDHYITDATIHKALCDPPWKGDKETRSNVLQAAFNYACDWIARSHHANAAWHEPQAVRRDILKAVKDEAGERIEDGSDRIRSLRMEE